MKECTIYSLLTLLKSLDHVERDKLTIYLSARASMGIVRQSPQVPFPSCRNLFASELEIFYGIKYIVNFKQREHFRVTVDL